MASSHSQPLVLSLRDVAVDRADTNGRPIRILDVAGFTLAPGDCIALSGPSGAGKSTCLEVVAGITVPDHGVAMWGEIVVSKLAESRRDAWRRDTVGFIFQDFHLVGELSALQNVLLPLRFSGWRLGGEARRRACRLIEHVGLTDPGRRAGLMSRGEQQRVAIARALIRSPALILADEPTASLDAETGAAVADLILTEARTSGATLIVASHDTALLARLDRRIGFAAGVAREVRP
ncbi:MAG: ATP-binding cassette domain-containing protein [Ancalomicrobiaceae bacterium]|nr:ATP-binding cassette domain-containing protein [Ancalomicrobiaceae bacterium]